MTTTTDARQATRDWRYWTVPETVIVDGLTTAYRRSGSGEPVLFLHGQGYTRSWLPFHEALAAQVDLIAPEHPGFGDSPRPAHFDAWDDWLLHYDGLLHELDLPRVHLVGHDFGGLLAAKLAVAYPDRFASVTLLNAPGLRLPAEPLRNPYRWDDAEADDATFNGRASRYSDVLIQQGSPDDDVQAYKEATTTAVLFWNPRYDRKLDVRLGRVKVPFLSLGVDDDRAIGDVMARRYAELVPGGQHATVSGSADEPSGHMVLIEQPQDTANAILAHIRAEQ